MEQQYITSIKRKYHNHPCIFSFFLERTPLLGGNHPNSHVTKNEAASHCGSDCHQPPDLMAPPENEAEGVTTHIYPKRFWILIVYSLLAWFQVRVQGKV